MSDAGDFEIELRAALAPFANCKDTPETRQDLRQAIMPIVARYSESADGSLIYEAYARANGALHLAVFERCLPELTGLPWVEEAVDLARRFRRLLYEHGAEDATIAGVRIER